MSKNIFKRDNWTNQEIRDFLEGQKLVPHKDSLKKYAEEYNHVLDTMKEFFFDFQRSVTEYGAMGFCKETGEIVHIGGIPPEHAEKWVEERVKND